MGTATKERKKPARKPAGKQAPPEADKPPRSKPQKSGAAKARERKSRELALIEEGFSALLTMPAMPMAIAGDQWAADHFTERGPQLAARLASECERNETLRKWCLKALEGQSVMLLGVEVFMYAAPVAMHYGLAPNVLGVPVVKAATKRKAPAGPAPGQRPPFESEPPYVRQADGSITRRDGSPLTPEDEAAIAAANGAAPAHDEEEPPIAFA